MNAKAPSRSRARADLTRIYAAAVAAVEPRRAMSRALNGDVVGANDVAAIIERAIGVRLLAVGKAALGMAAEAEQQLGDRLIDGLAIAPVSLASGPDAGALRSRVISAAHPLPDETSLAAARAALEMAARAKSGELLIIALSGGASALLAMPAGRVTLANKIAITDALMRAGATIRELNVVRKHLSAIKGGRLLAATAPGVGVLTAILSDVPGNDLATIGSGPTVADPSTYSDAIGVLKRRRAWGRAPETVRDHLERGAAGEFGETVKAGAPALARVTNLIVGDNRMAVDGAAEAASALGYEIVRGAEVGGEANDVGRTVARQVSEISAARVCLVGGGEPVVTVTGNGRGGRAQQCSLAMAIELASVAAGRKILAMFAGTDGIDGPTDAAGAIATPETVERAADAGVDASAALARNDAYEFFKGLGDLVIIGPTGTNVADIMVVLVNY
jgi:glycerate 2-kinase